MAGSNIRLGGETGKHVALKKLWLLKALWVRLPPQAPKVPRQRLTRTKISWTPDLAYVVGLLTTDGYISKDKRHIVLVSTDTQLLETFRSCLNKNNAISHNPPGGFSGKSAYRIQLGDVVLYDQLISIGLHPNKSLTIGKLNIPDHRLRFTVLAKVRQ
jgi:hypothetical protein